MEKIIPKCRVRQPFLETGQIWRMADASLQVVMVGKRLVHYKLGKPDAVRAANRCNTIETIEIFLRTKKAVLA